MSAVLQPKTLLPCVIPGTITARKRGDNFYELNAEAAQYTDAALLAYCGAGHWGGKVDRFRNAVLVQVWAS